ncbi:MAG: TA system VapC family ribonuclease toxin [Bryobacteraceae bacterium]|nr:TA system VapC family ribonuclease toxin [Bryobacteraceae bacterium]
MTTYLPDVNVWLALAVEGHVHHEPSRRWLEEEAAGSTLLFCRVTEMGLLRLLTSRSILGRDALSPAAAWKVRDAFFQDDRIRFEAEPPEAESWWRRATTAEKSAGPSFWTDAWLASFAAATGATLVTFDAALAGRRGIHSRRLR